MIFPFSISNRAISDPSLFSFMYIYLQSIEDHSLECVIQFYFISQTSWFRFMKKLMGEMVARYECNVNFPSLCIGSIDSPVVVSRGFARAMTIKDRYSTVSNGRYTRHASMSVNRLIVQRSMHTYTAQCITSGPIGKLKSGKGAKTAKMYLTFRKRLNWFLKSKPSRNSYFNIEFCAILIVCAFLATGKYSNLIAATESEPVHLLTDLMLSGRSIGCAQTLNGD